MRSYDLFGGDVILLIIIVFVFMIGAIDIIEIISMKRKRKINGSSIIFVIGSIISVSVAGFIIIGDGPPGDGPIGFVGIMFGLFIFGLTLLGSFVAWILSKYSSSTPNNEKATTSNTDTIAPLPK